MRHSGAILNKALKVSVLSLTLCHNITFIFCKFCIIFTLSLWPVNEIFWITQFHSIYNGSNSLPGFFNTSLVFLILYLYVKWNAVFTRISLPVYHSFIQRWFTPHIFLKTCPFLFSIQKSNNLVFFDC